MTATTKALLLLLLLSPLLECLAAYVLYALLEHVALLQQLLDHSIVAGMPAVGRMLLHLQARTSTSGKHATLSVGQAQQKPQSKI